MNLVVIGASTKSWLSGLDVATNSWTKYGQASVLVHCGSIKNFQARSLSSRRFESKILGDSESLVLNLRPQVKNLWTAMRITLQLKNKESIEKFRSYRVGDLQLGEIVYSRLCASMHSSHYSIEEVKNFQLFKFIFEAVSAYTRAVCLFREFPIQQVYVFNGREPLEAAFISAARSHNKGVAVIERGCDPEHYEIYKRSPHLSSDWWEKIQEYGRQFPEARLRYLDKKAEDYATAKSQGFDVWENKAWNSMMNSESSKSEAITPNRYIVFFSSSTKEVSPFPDFNDPTDFKTQLEAVEELISVAIDLGYWVVIRRHPNSMTPTGIDREETLWQKFSNVPKVIYLPPTDKSNSYQLMKHAQSVFVWISTIGFDAMVNNKPVYSLGAARWDFEGSRQAWSMVDIQQALANGDCDYTKELFTYANYMSHYGTKYTCCKSLTRIGAVLESGDIIPLRLKDEVRANVRKFLPT